MIDGKPAFPWAVGLFSLCHQATHHKVFGVSLKRQKNKACHQKQSMPTIESRAVPATIVEVDREIIAESNDRQATEGNLAAGSGTDPGIVTAVEQILEAAARRKDGVRLRRTIYAVGSTKLLHHAAQSGHIELLEILLEEDCLPDVNALLEEEGSGRTALILACWEGYTETVWFLLQNGADVLIATRDGLTCLHIAAFCGHSEIVNLLVHGKRNHRARWEEWNDDYYDDDDDDDDESGGKSHRKSGESWNDQDYDNGKSYRAGGEERDDATDDDVYVGCCWKIQRKSGEKRNYQDDDDGKSNREGSEERDDDSDSSVPVLSAKRCWALIARKTSIEKFTALHMAASGNHDKGVTIAASILEGLRTSLLDIYGLAPNPEAAYDIQTESWLDYWLKIRHEFHSHDRDTPQDQVFLQNLAAYGNGGGGSALHKTLGTVRYEALVKTYLELISYSNSRDVIGRTALHHAAWEGKHKLVKFLMWDSSPHDNPSKSILGGVANVNVADVDGHTPLHLASRKAHRRVVQELLGIELKHRLGKGIKQLMDAIPEDNNYIDPNSAAHPTGRSLEILTASRRATKKMFGERNRDRLPRPEMENSVWSEDRGGLTALHDAVENEHADVVGKLITHWKTDVFQQASNGQSPWSIAFPVTGPWHDPDLARYLTQTQRSLRGDSEAHLEEWALLRKKGRKQGRKRSRTLMHQRKLLKQAISLASRAESGLDLWDELHLLENQILLTFETALRQAFLVSFVRRSTTAFQAEKTHVAGDYYSSTLQPEEPDEVAGDDQYWNLNLLHAAAYYGFGQELEELVKLTRYKKLVNEKEWLTLDRYTPLDFALHHGRAHIVAVLLKVENLILTNRRAKRYSADSTAYIDLVKKEFESEMDLLCLDQEYWATLVESTKKLTDESDLYRNRQVYVDAANAILVGAALIASVTFAGFLQPPLGYVQYDTDVNATSPAAPPSTPESFAAVKQHKSVRVFWVFNSLSFFFSIATVITGAGAVLPSSGYSIGEEVLLVKRWLKVTSALLATSICFVLGAFTAAGSASLPNIAKYQFSIVSTAAIGLVVSLVALCAFCYRLLLSLRPMKVVMVIGLLVILQAGTVLYFLFRPVLHRIAEG